MRSVDLHTILAIRRHKPNVPRKCFLTATDYDWEMYNIPRSCNCRLLSDGQISASIGRRAKSYIKVEIGLETYCTRFHGHTSYDRGGRGKYVEYTSMLDIS